MDFTETFSVYSNTDLLRILESPENYQPQAVETAKAIFASRQLSEPEMEISRKELAIERQKKQLKEQMKRENEHRAKNIGYSILDSLNSIHNGTPTVEKIIRIISVVFGGLFLFLLYDDFGMIVFMFSSGAKWDLGTVFYFLPLVLVPTATFLFFKREKIGWTLLSIYLIYSVIQSIWLFALTLNVEPSGMPALDRLFPQTSPVTFLLGLAFFGGALWTICKANIREMYSVSGRYMITTISVAAVLTALTNYGLSM